MKKVLFALAFALASSSALAQEQHGPQSGYLAGQDGLFDMAPHHRQTDLSLMFWLPWYYGFGVGGEVRFEIPIVPDGFIPTLNDEFDIEPSLGFAETTNGVYNYWVFDPAAYAVWGFHLNRMLRVYGALGLGVEFAGLNNNPYGYGGGYTHFYWDVAAGVNFKLTNNFALRGELGYGGFKGGIQFYF